MYTPGEVLKHGEVDPRADGQRVIFMRVDDFIVYRLQGKSMI